MKYSVEDLFIFEPLYDKLAITTIGCTVNPNVFGYVGMLIVPPKVDDIITTMVYGYDTSIKWKITEVPSPMGKTMIYDNGKFSISIDLSKDPYNTFLYEENTMDKAKVVMEDIENKLYKGESENE